MSNDERDKQAQQYAELVNDMAKQADLEEEHEVPNWHRAAAFEHYSLHVQGSTEKPPWWHWQGMAGVALAMSVTSVALLSVYLIKDNPMDQQAIARLVKAQVVQQIDVEVNRKLREFASEQQVILAHYKVELSERQERNNLQLAGYVLSSTRSERKEDMNDFISFINAERKDEQLEQKIKFQQLEQAIGFRKANFNQ